MAAAETDDVHVLVTGLVVRRSVPLITFRADLRRRSADTPSRTRPGSPLSRCTTRSSQSRHPPIQPRYARNPKSAHHDSPAAFLKRRRARRRTAHASRIHEHTLHTPPYARLRLHPARRCCRPGRCVSRSARTAPGSTSPTSRAGSRSCKTQPRRCPRATRRRPCAARARSTVTCQNSVLAKVGVVRPIFLLLPMLLHRARRESIPPPPFGIQMPH